MNKKVKEELKRGRRLIVGEQGRGRRLCRDD